MLRKIFIVPFVIALSLSLLACSGAPSAPAATETPAQGSVTTADDEATASDTSSDTDSTTAETGDETAATTGELRTFTIVPGESSASYIAQEEIFAGALAKYGIEVGNYEVRGTTPGVSGQLSLDLNTATLGENHFSVDLTGLETDRNQRDEWIQGNGPRFASFPTAEFTATEIQNAPENYSEGEEANFQLVGDLTVREITQPVTFDVTATLEGDTIHGVATAPLRMSDFGIEQLSFANTLTVADEFRIEVNFTAREQ